MTIGFFSPLPLAYMVPFMAAQSLAMGEAFGKSFQFGKRKISAMSNEDFNKFTFQDMNNELVADVASLIPTMNNQLNASIELQKNIFKHMLGLIPIFINEVAIAANQFVGNFANPHLHFPETPTGNLLPLAGADTSSQTTDFNQGTVEDIPIKEISTQKYNQSIFRAMPLNELIKGINSERFTGSDLSLAKHVLSTRQQTEEAPIPITPQGEQWKIWNKKLVLLEQKFLATKSKYYHFIASAPNGGTVRRYKFELIDIAKFIRAMSNDYRSPNNSIRQSALRLRQEIANGLLKY